MKAVYLIDGVRTAVGKYGGSLAGIRPDDLLAAVISDLLRRNPLIDVEAIEDVIAGDANQAGEDCRNVARMAVLLAGLPVTVPGNTVNRLCASGLQAVMDAARGIACGEGELYIAGGVESMSRAPLVMDKRRRGEEKDTVYDSTIGWRFTNPRLAEKFSADPMGKTAERVAAVWKIGREEQDQFAVESHEKYFTAAGRGIWEAECAGINITNAKGQPEIFAADEIPRLASGATIRSLKPVFEAGGTVTAGNAAAISDGAAVLLLASESAVKRYGLSPIARVVTMAVAGVEPGLMGMGPVPAVRKALQRAGLSISDCALVELNEAFAATALACRQELGIDPLRLNVNGGSLAIGHPLGCSGARILTTLLHETGRRPGRYGLATLCAGLGQGAAMVIEKTGNW